MNAIATRSSRRRANFEQHAVGQAGQRVVLRGESRSTNGDVGERRDDRILLGEHARSANQPRVPSR